jgi:hypothetical protein
MDNQPDLFSGDSFDWRAFWPKPQPDLKAAPLSGKDCEFLVFMWKSGRRNSPKARCIHAGRSYRVNHVALSICRFHAAQLRRHNDIEVLPDADAIAALAEH